MARKVADLVQNNKRRQSERAKSFSFTDQFTDGQNDPVAAGKQNPPDNFDVVAASGAGEDSMAGSYFRTKGKRASTKQHDVAHHQADHQQPHPAALAKFRGGTFRSTAKSAGGSTMGGSHRRRTPAERQAELDEHVHARMLQSLAEQEEEDRLRREACQVQRQVERLKMQQRITQRIETQLAASQRPLDKSVTAMGIDVDAILSQPKAATIASQHRAALKDEPNATYVHYNMTRMQHNLAHRQYCIQTLQERQRMRMAMEKGVHAYYAVKKAKQLKAVGAEDDMACRFPTVAEMHKQQQRADAERARQALDEERVQEQVVDVTKKDEILWAERRAIKGQRAPRIRELPYDIDRPYVKEKDVKPPHLPVLVHAPEVKKPSTAPSN